MTNIAVTSLILTYLISETMSSGMFTSMMMLMKNKNNDPAVLGCFACRYYRAITSFNIDTRSSDKITLTYFSDTPVVFSQTVPKLNVLSVI